MEKHYFENLKVGDIVPNLGVSIAAILVGSTTFVIFLDSNNKFHCGFDEHKGVDRDKSVVEALSLVAQLEVIGGLRPSAVVKGRDLIAAGLSHALDHRMAKDQTEFFATARSYIVCKATETSQAIYLLSAFISALYLMSATRYPALLGLTQNQREWCQVIGFGALGTLLSVLQRFRAITVSLYATPAFISLDGVIRIALGATFGVVLLLLQKGDLFLTATKANVYATALFAVIAGLNERFIPNVLERAAAAAGKVKMTKDHKERGTH